MRVELTAARLRELLHYDPETGVWTRRVPMTVKRKGVVAGYLADTGYILIGVDRRQYAGHRLAFLYMTGKWPATGMFVDHINGVRSDMRWCNLRAVSPAANGQNRIRPPKPYYVDRDDLWYAQFTRNGERFWLGCFKTEDEGQAAIIAAIAEYDRRRAVSNEAQIPMMLFVQPPAPAQGSLFGDDA
jgi:hypothetical protein